MQTLVIHGRQPALGRAELESLYGADGLRPVGEVATVLDIDPKDIDFSRLGGMVKFCKVLTVLDTTDWEEIQKFLENTGPAHAANLPEGKLRLGLSTYELRVTPGRLQATGLQLKKIIKKTGRSVRYVPNVQTDLNAAQVLHNQLTQKMGWELVFVRDGSKTIVAQSIAVQDIEKYAARDQERPYRDSRVGMLPPKLAQIIINLANPPENAVILDPFCGTGVILQEALLMGYGVFGSDIDRRMVEYSEGNLRWLQQRMSAQRALCCHTEVADATKKTWEHGFDFIACETYLGRALSSLPDASTLQKISADCDTIHTKFLQNVARQTSPGFKLCLAVPAWKIKNGFQTLSTLDKLTSLGYNRLSFVHANARDLIYHRPGQIVARELVILERT